MKPYADVIHNVCGTVRKQRVDASKGSRLVGHRS
jgi:hypothetical protein